MKTALKGLLLACIVLSLTGCATGVTGHWTLASFKPEAEKGNFQLGSMCLEPDGKYAANAAEGGKTEAMTGTYTYDKSTNALTFAMPGGKQRTYNAELVGSDEMQVSEHGKDWVATMKRDHKCDGKQCKDQSSCCPAGGAKKGDAAACPMMNKGGTAPQKAEPNKPDANKAEPKK